jgi:uncharacterized repeat protein (TIGR03803 family)
MKRLSVPRTLCVSFAFCAATAITVPAQVLTTLYFFCPAGFPCTDGYNPQAGLVQAADGNFYGTTVISGANCPPYGCGTVFKITPSGTLTTLYSFCPQSGCTDGANPVAGLVQATDGNFYGTTNFGGAYGGGTLFKITPHGTLTTLYSFCSQTNCADGRGLYAGLIQATDGNLYGTTYGGGPGGSGTIFKITPSGALTTLYIFCIQGRNCADGANPGAGLVQAADGNFYGTTVYGGANCPPYGCGTVFKITPQGTLTTLYRFDFDRGEGVYPVASLVQARDGNFYGTTNRGGAYDGAWGTVFKVTSGGTLTTLHSFDYTDGIYPAAAVIQATDGNFYGTTNGGGTHNAGTVFKITASGTLTTLHSFGGGDGADLYGGVIQATDGNFYGMTYAGGPHSGGTVFRLVLPRKCIVCPAAE